jgi:serine/threonine protein kinase/predicted Zn-dependent protease
LAPAQVAAVLLIDQRERWQRGDRRPAEAYLDLYPHFRDDFEFGLELVYGEYLLCAERGETPDLQAYCRRFPAYASRLQLQVEIHQALAAPDGTDPTQTELASAGVAGESVPGLAPGSAPAGYEVLGELGRGGMGVVYRARHIQLNRIVALKMLRSAGPAEANDLARFRTEAEAIARLQHPNIVQVFEIGTHEGGAFLALEFCSGGSLKEALAGTPLAPRPAAALTETLAGAMHAAHQMGVIHRDLKPANILLQELTTEDPEYTEKKAKKASSSSFSVSPVVNLLPKIADFGLAKKLDEPGQTVTGLVMGTPSYMPPEQAAGHSKEIGRQADIYALGAILYEALTGRPPFQGATALETLQQVRTQDPVPPTRLQPRTPPDLETICLKCLHKEPVRRYASALELADDLRRFLEERPIQARPPSLAERVCKFTRRNRALVGGTAAVLAVLVLGLVGTTVGWLNTRAQWQQTRQAEAKVTQERDRVRTAEERTRELLVASHEHSALGSMARGDWPAALRYLDEALRVGGAEEVRLRLQKVKAHSALHQLPQALAELEALSRRRDLGDHEGSVLLWRADLDLVRRVNDEQTLKQIRRARGLKLPGAEQAYADGLLADTVDEAVHHFQSALAQDRLHYRATCMLSTLLIVMGRTAEARDYLTFADLVFPHDPTIKVLHALGEALEDHPDKVAAWLEKAQKELDEPQRNAVRELLDFVSSLRQIFHASEQSGRAGLGDFSRLLQAAAKLFARRLDFRQISAQLYLPLPPVLSRVMSRLPALLLQSVLWTDRTIDEIRPMVRAVPVGFLYFWLGQLLAKKDRLEEAAQAFQNACDKPSPFPIKKSALVNVIYCDWLVARQGERRDQRSRNQKVLENLRQLLRLDDVPLEDASALVKIAVSLGELDLARSILVGWERQAPDNLEALRMRALVELRGGAYGRAIAAADKVLGKQPGDREATLYRTQALDRFAKEAPPRNKP